MEVKIPPFGYALDEWDALPLAEKALLIGAQEHDAFHSEEEPRGSNKGPRVTAYLLEAGVRVPAPWCAAFVYWCLKQAKPGFHGPTNPASVASWVAWANGQRRIRSTPARGRLFYTLNANGTGHIGFCASGGDPYKTVEGNTNTDGSREGYAVCRRTRSIKEVKGFIDLGAAV